MSDPTEDVPNLERVLLMLRWPLKAGTVTYTGEQRDLILGVVEALVRSLQRTD